MAQKASSVDAQKLRYDSMKLGHLGVSKKAKEALISGLVEPQEAGLGLGDGPCWGPLDGMGGGRPLWHGQKQGPKKWIFGQILIRSPWLVGPSRPRQTLPRRISGPGGGPPTHQPPPATFRQAPFLGSRGRILGRWFKSHCGHDSLHSVRGTKPLRTAILPGIHLNPFDFRS